MAHRAAKSYSVGFTLPESTPDLLKLIPTKVWAPALDAHDAVRDGAWVAELTDLMDLTAWPPGMRVIVRKERPHPGAQLRFEDVDGMRITAFATNTTRGQLPDLELRHRRRARVEDRIRIAKDTGLNNLPLASFAANRIWCAVVALASEITAWMGMLALHDHDARRWEPKTLRGSDSSPSRPRWPEPAGACACTSRPAHPSPSSPSTASPGSAPWPPADREHHRPDDTEHDPGPWNRRPPRTTAGGPSHPHATINTEHDHRAVHEPHTRTQ